MSWVPNPQGECSEPDGRIYATHGTLVCTRRRHYNCAVEVGAVFEASLAGRKVGFLYISNRPARQGEINRHGWILGERDRPSFYAPSETPTWAQWWSDLKQLADAQVEPRPAGCVNLCTKTGRRDAR